MINKKRNYSSVEDELTAYPGSSDFFESTKLFSPYQSSLTELIILFTNEKTIDLAASPISTGKLKLT